MKTKLLLLLLLLSYGIAKAQDTIKTVIISEVRIDDTRPSYIEITNMGDESVNLSEFEIGRIGAWTSPLDDDGNMVVNDLDADYWMMLPDQELASGKSFTIKGFYDWTSEQYLIDPTEYNEFLTKKEWDTLADVKLHMLEDSSDPTDSVSDHYSILETWNGRDCIYLRHHVSETDSVVVDQVNGFWDDDGTNEDDGNFDIAGMTAASYLATLVRKYSVKEGNLDFASASGTDIEESEWIPVPHLLGSWEMNRALFWTAGNHGDYNLDENTLVSTTVDVDWDNNIITVPWGVRNDDSIMFLFDRLPGIAWHYDYVESYEDSAYVSVRSGDVLTVYACGEDLDTKVFTLQVEDPATDANIVVPKYVPAGDSTYADLSIYCVVTDGVAGMDTISDIGYAARADSLLHYLEKAPNASWEFVWVDGVERTYLVDGDILRVTAEDGSTKDYYIKPDPYYPSHDATLASITWPDISDIQSMAYYWTGDTIPGFSAGVTEYIVIVPADYDKVLPLVAKTEDENATVETERAVDLDGGPSYSILTFTTIAEDDSTSLTYSITFQKDPESVATQPWSAKPFISEYIFGDQWANQFLEICNPGTETLDLSDYMICFSYETDPASVIEEYTTTDDYDNRYKKYIPGYKWTADSSAWQVDPALAIEDSNIDPNVAGGDVFVMGEINSTSQSYGSSGYGEGNWPAENACDIDFLNNPWNETISEWTTVNTWFGFYYLFEILNDSIKDGTKAATDPNDFDLIDCFADDEGSNSYRYLYVEDGELVVSEQINAYIRKPAISVGNPTVGGTYGTDKDEETCEWIIRNRAYYTDLGYSWPMDILMIGSGLGSHYLNETTVYKSTVYSLYYNVSDGYSEEETIEGVVTGTDVETFLSFIIKADTGQALVLLSSTDGSALSSDAELSNGDTLQVTSADETNVTKYILEVGDALNSDAVLTSETYTIEVSGETGTVAGFDYGTTLSTVVDNIVVPDGASLTMIDEDDDYVSLVKLNFDTVYVDVPVSSDIYFEVVAEDGETTILYQLLPTTSETEALVTSDVFAVDQDIPLISLIPQGIIAPSFLSNLTPSTGATIKLVDKFGMERAIGDVYKDDKIVVTAQDGKTSKSYYLGMLSSDEYSYIVYVTSNVYIVDQVNMGILGIYEDETIDINAFLANLTLVGGTSMTITDASGVEKSGNVNIGDKLKITTSDENVNIYYLILSPQVTSYVYDVDPRYEEISDGIYNDITEVSTFLENLIAFDETSLTVVDSEGVEKALTDKMAFDDMLYVSYNGNVVLEYSIIVEYPHVTSTVYTVDKESLEISGDDLYIGITSVSDFISNLTKIEGTSISVVDSDGTEKASTDKIEFDDELYVTLNGVVVLEYSIITVYPHVTSSEYSVNKSALKISGDIYNGITSVSDFIAGLTKVEGTTLTVVDSVGVEKVSTDKISFEDKLYVSIDGVVYIEYLIVPEYPYIISFTYTVDDENMKISGSIYNGATYISDIIQYLLVVDGAVLSVVDDEGTTKESTDQIGIDYQLLVSDDLGTTVLEYSITTEQPYITSDVYTINITDMEISGDLIDEVTVISTFLGNISYIDGTTIVVVDDEGTTKASTDKLNADDVLQVTDVNGNVILEYQINIELSSDVSITSETYVIDSENKIISGNIEEDVTTVSDLLGSVTPGEVATLTIIDSSGAEKSSGTLSEGDVLRVTAPDGTVDNYTIEFVSSSDAYVLSSVYTVTTGDEKQISGNIIIDNTTVETLLGNLTPAKNATVVVVDANGTEKTGTLSEGDIVKVTSEDESTVNEYTIVFLSNDASLSGLSVSAGTLDPEFSSETYSYTLELVSSELPVTITPTTTNSGATYSGGGEISAFGDVTITVTAVDGVVTKEYVIAVTQKSAIYDISSAAIHAYPNPATTNLTVDGLAENAIVQIVNLTGQIVFSEKSNSTIMNISLDTFTKGVYIMRVQLTDNVYTTRFIKQ